MTLNLQDADMASVETLAELDGLSKTEWIREACKHYAPLSVLRRRDPAAYHKIMTGAFNVAQHSAWTPLKLASDEQSALLVSEVGTDIMRDYYRRQASQILGNKPPEADE